MTDDELLLVYWGPAYIAYARANSIILTTTNIFVDSIEPDYIHGHSLNGSSEPKRWQRRVTPYVDDPTDYWLSRDQWTVFQESGYTISKENVKYLEDLFSGSAPRKNQITTDQDADHWVDGVYYICGLIDSLGTFSNDGNTELDSGQQFSNEVVNIFFNTIVKSANERGVFATKCFQHSSIVVALRLVLVDKFVDKKHFQYLLEKIDAGTNVVGLMYDPMFVRADTSVVDEAIQAVLNENLGKLDGSDKMLNWFVGQVMRRTQGKADALYVRDQLKALS